MSEERIVEALRTLSEQDASKEASPEVETRLRFQFQSRRRRRAWRRAAVLAGTGTTAAAAAAMIVFLIVASHKPPAPAPVHEVVTQSVVAQPEAAPVAVVKATRHVPKSVPRPQEVVTDFFPLMDPAPPFERGQLLRVELPASAMQMVGLPVREDRLAEPVQADVLVGEEGLPRAIRFVGFELK
ncbi:MAG TPA: hypothetical protein VK687_11085 [Bryobacteraceae bacterium]|jgi:hypothetical protein|nr:hypothetical protein [Bryobacteraceae bacterium]